MALSRHMIMDIWGMSKKELEDGSKIFEIICEAADIIDIELIDFKIITADNGIKMVVFFQEGWLVATTYKDQSYMTIDCYVDGRDGRSAAMCEYIFRQFGGPNDTSRASALFERGEYPDAENNETIN